MPNLRTVARLSLVPVAFALGTVVTTPASAHVSISPSDAEAEAFTVATVSVPHGCDGSASTRIAIKIPEQILSVTPTRHPFWDVEKVLTKVDPPATDAHGNTVTERVGQIVYTAREALPEGQRDAFELSFQVPDAAGETLLFPTVQTCEKGSTAWVESTVEGGAEPEHPAPSLTVVAASDEPQESIAAAGDDGDGVAWAGLGLGGLGIVLGGTALARGRRGSASS